MATEQQQITSLYDRLTDINNALSDRALNSRITTLNAALVTRFDAFAANLTAAETAMKKIQLDLADVITDLRSAT